MENKYEENKYIDISKQDESCIITCAIRYCLGRQTYMPSLITDCLSSRIPFMTDGCLIAAQRDIDEYFRLEEKSEHKSFDDILTTWVDFRKKIIDEIEKRNLHY